MKAYRDGLILLARMAFGLFFWAWFVICCALVISGLLPVEKFDPLSTACLIVAAVFSFLIAEHIIPLFSLGKD